MSDLLQQFGLVPYFTQQLTDTSLLQERVGRVTSVQRSKISVIIATGERTVDLSADIRQAPAIDRPTVGDWVVLDESLSRIEKILERKTLFRRLGAGKSNEIQPIAANIDTLFIVTSCNDEFKESRLERYLALCAEAGAIPVIVLTKADLVDDVDIYVRRARNTQAGVAVETANALDPATLDGVRSWIDKTSTVALVGSSGVGKSTLLNTLAGHSVTATGKIRENDQKGRHTTTHRELHVLPSGGNLIDVPGIRELKVAEINDAIGTVFGDIEALAKHCQFADCGHDTEPGCSVLQAIADNRIDGRRLANYKKLLREDALATETMADKRVKGKHFARIIKEAKSMKQRKTET